MNFAIVIPVYNEGKAILDTIDQLISKVKGEYHAYFVYDQEQDPTIPYIMQKNDRRLILLKNKYGRGALNAIKTGLEETKEDHVVVFMADLSEDPVYINDMIVKADSGYDIVCGSRYMKGGAQIGAPVFKSFLSRMAGLSLRILTGIPTYDISNSFKLYSREVLNSIKIESTGGFEIGMEIVVKAYLKGYKITEVPVVWRERDEGTSNFKFSKWLPKYLHWYFYLLLNKLKRVH
jgi:glycosyltransferase involved in cell wall biosynthesis